MFSWWIAGERALMNHSETNASEQQQRERQPQ
jgi:hypothetical protein